ncbi:MaoC/PaaZ C-terminal domain-containing protein [Nonomuraea sp. NPDC049400]|uniref:MaoC/PaaZ C-terminal domain-containing protein n=1 Tax=Nonomuraea sp. NPDC049400 TaxID=3364352 RepID=UPI0037B0D730
MVLDHTVVGVEGPAHERTWTPKDTMLYALGAGAGTSGLEFTTEKGQRVLPTFAVLAAQAPRPPLGDFDPALLVHAEQAARAGFDRPILHGLCTYAVTGRTLPHLVAGSDPARFQAMSGRFTSPVFPGESLTVSIWVDGGEVLFRTAKDDGTVVLDRGRATILPP